MAEFSCPNVTNKYRIWSCRLTEHFPSFVREYSPFAVVLSKVINKQQEHTHTHTHAHTHAHTYAHLQHLLWTHSEKLLLPVVTLFPPKRAQLKISRVQEDSCAAQLVLSMSIFSSVIANSDHRPLPRFVYQSSVSFPPQTVCL